MTKEEIIALGVTEEQAAKVLELHEKEQSEARAKGNSSERENRGQTETLCSQ